MGDSTTNNKVRFGIALSGGGARGIAHIGVLAALEKYGIKPQIVSGTSMGAIVGVLYAAGISPEESLEIIKSKSFSKVAKWHLPHGGLINMERVDKVLKEKIGKDNFSALKLPFHCSVTNLNSGLAEIKTKGKLIQWVLASASIPVVFEPQIIDGQTYVDGGLLNNLPSESIRKKCQVLIGVHVNHNGPQYDVDGMFTIAERCFRLGIAQNVNESKNICDFLIEPPETRNYSTFAFHKAQDIYQIGFDTTEKQIARAFQSIDLQKIIDLKQNLLKK
jgi:NTE family protein